MEMKLVHQKKTPVQALLSRAVITNVKEVKIFDNKSKKAGTTFLLQSHAFSGGRNSRKSVLVFGVDMLVRHNINGTTYKYVFIISTDGYTTYLRKRNDKHPINQIGLVMVYT